MNDNNKPGIMQSVEFAVTTPVHKLNFDDENVDIIAGMYLITNDKYKEILDKFIDKSKTTDNAVLVFESRHLYELGGLIYGLLVPINGNDHSIEDIIECVSYFLGCAGNYLCYRTLKRSISYHINNRLKVEDGEYKNRLLYIMENIWFLPYDKIDQLVRMGIDEFKKKSEGSDSDGNKQSDGNSN